MKNLSRILMLLVMMVAAVALPVALRADTPGPHPHYLHALSNLRAARANIAGLKSIPTTVAPSIGLR